ncbi:MAG: lamin tail domain-containing protein [Myxococcota bacterium]
MIGMLWALSAHAGEVCAPGPGAAVVINEIFADPDGADAGAEWVELANRGPDPVDLGGWRLAAGTSAYAEAAPLPATVLAPGAHLVVGQGPDVDVVVDGLSLGNASSSADAVQLRDPSGAAVDTVVYGPANPDGWLDDAGRVASCLAPPPPPGGALARQPDAADTDRGAVDFAAVALPTPGQANDALPACAAGEGPAPRLNEILPDPDGTDEGAEWVELFNPTDGPVALGGWRLVAASAADHEAVAVLPDVDVPARGWLLLGAGGARPSRSRSATAPTPTRSGSRTAAARSSTPCSTARPPTTTPS